MRFMIYKVIKRNFCTKFLLPEKTFLQKYLSKTNSVLHSESKIKNVKI